MKFSLIVVTTDRLNLVQRLFTNLCAQTHKDFEILFVHGPKVAEAALKTLLEPFAGLDLKILVSQDHCLSRSRNLALPQVTGDIIAFPDDDCVYEPDTLARCAEAFARSPQPDVILGRTADLDADIAATGFALKPCSSRYALFRHSVSYVQFHKKNVVQVVGGFDENLGVGCATPYQSGEDTDYVLRAFEQHFAIAHTPAVVVRHPVVDLRDPSLQVKVKNYAAGRMYLLRKYGLPLWFRLANVAYPLARLPVECLRACLPVARYRWGMFRMRLEVCRNGDVER
ncbi:MAG: glycosyltransferase family 2 protein [Desulfovibrio sp.]|nr:glycosyltransferase family 2 protein [Desulfovibrio sp.]